MSAAPGDAKRRVKLYALNASRQWDDKGTGHVTSCYHEPLDGMSLLVRNEADNSLMLESKIQLDTSYQKQQGTLIVWTESDNYDLALSFQEQDGCNEIWEKICQVQGKDPTHEDNDEEEDIRVNLVECDQDKLQLILEQITAFSQTTRRRDALASEYIEHNYIQKLLDLFHKAEEIQELTTLHRLYEIFKQLFLYDRPTLTEAMLSEQILMDVIGVFEYEPPQQQQQQQNEELSTTNNDNNNISNTSNTETETDNSLNNNNTINDSDQQSSTPEPQQDQQKSIQRRKHRDFLLRGTTFKEVIPFSNQRLVDKIHQTYRVQYLQSSVLPAPSILEDNAYTSLSNILFFNKVEIVSMIQENEEFLQNLFNQIISNETGIERKRELVLFLREYCIFSQTIQVGQREGFFKTLASLKILSAVEVALSSDDPVIKAATIDIFTYLVEYSPHMTREHAVQQREGLIDPPNSNAQTANILKLVIEHITTDQDPELGIATQLSCIIRLILDPENMPGDSHGKHLFLEFFYNTCMQSLVEPIRSSTTSSGNIEPSANDRKTAQLLSIMLELLTFFIEHHYSQLRNYIVNSDLLTRIISLIKSRHKFLVLSVVRFFRRLLATKDEVYFDLIMNANLFSPVIQVLKNNNGRYNLLDSAILEMFESIQTVDFYPLIDHILTNFGPTLESIDYVNTFKFMRQKKETLRDAIREGRTRDDRVDDPIILSVLPRSPSEGMYFERDTISPEYYPSAAGVGDVNEADSDKDLDPDTGDATVDPDGLNLPELGFTMNGDKNEDVDEEEDEDVEDEDDIQMDEEDCEDELEPQFKKKKTK